MEEKQTLNYTGQNSDLRLVLILHLNKLCATGGKSNFGDYFKSVTLLSI